MTHPPALALECRDVSVNYGPVAALSGVSLGFAPGLIHAVVGQNGAGKTTFARVAAGIVRPSSGTLAIGGQPVPVGRVGAARAAGVELVHQSFALPPSFTVAEALEFGATGPAGVFSRRGLERRWAGHLESLGVRVSLSARIRDLAVETQQGVEIARALVSDARVLILDEPTAVLSPPGIATLFDRLRVMKAGGVTILLILHKIREVLGVADTVSVLRGGRLVDGPRPVAETGPEALAAAIIGTGGEAGAQPGPATPRPGRSGANLLSVEAVSTRPDPEGPALEDVSLSVGAGEIVGIAGVEGNGQRTLVRMLADLATVAEGRVRLAGQDITGVPLRDRRALGLRVIPFERNAEGLSLSSALWENWAAGPLLAGRALRLIDPGALRRNCDAALRGWDVRFASTAQAAGSLSGGNAQKLILSREVDAGARLIIAAQPTRGLDVGATAFVWTALRAARDRGCGILLISSDLDELFDISDRVLVMLSGRISGQFAPPYALGPVGDAMTGAGR